VPLLVVGGHSRNIGKTSVVEGLIRALPDCHWTAVKVTQYGHGMCSTAGEPCACEVIDYEHPFAVSEEHGNPEKTDSARYLAAGARRSLWVRTAQGQLGHAMPAIRDALASAENAILESNSILQFVQPDLYLVVLDFAQQDFKPSSLRYLDRADALITVERGMEGPRWTGVSRKLWETKLRFRVEPPQWVTDEMVSWVKAKLAASAVAALRPSKSG
jgi:hypothetical protein